MTPCTPDDYKVKLLTNPVLLQAGAKVDVRTQDGLNPLMLAAADDHAPEVITMLASESRRGYKRKGPERKDSAGVRADMGRNDRSEARSDRGARES